MSEDKNVSVEFFAKTGSAVAEIERLAASIREQTTAARGAGEEQQTLGREIAQTRAAQVAAADATRKANEAQQLHTLTVQKFGRESREARESEARLTKATEEAARAGTAAAAALEKTAKAVGEAAAAEDGKLSPATKRAAAQLERMGKDAARASQDLQKIELRTKSAGGGFDLMGLASGKLMSVIGPAALGGTLIALAGWIGEASSRTLQYETAMSNLPFALAGAQAATHGLMSESKLAVSASQALAMGVVKTEAQFNQLASDAAKIALKLGTSTDQMLGDLTTALGRGSAMILDNAGIILKVSDANEAYAKSVGKTVEQLDEAEKKIAFQTAAMEAIRKSADATTVAYDSNAAAVARLKVGMGDAWEAVERGTVNSAGAVLTSIASIDDELVKLQAASDAATREIMRSEGWSQGFKDTAAAVGLAAAEILVAKDAIANWSVVLNDPDRDKKAAEGLAREQRKRDLMAEEAHFAELQEKALAKIAKDQEAHLEAQAAASVVYGPAPPPKEKKRRGAGRKKAEAMDPGDVALARIHDGRMDDSVSFEPQLEFEEAQRQKLFEARQLGMEREQELLDARGLAEEEAQAASERLLDRRLEAEAEYARQQMRFARTDAQREAATTRMEAVEHQKRIANLRRAAAAEEAEKARQVAVVEKVTAKVTDLGTAMVDAAWEAAEGQKGAGLKALGDYLKTVSKQMAVKAAVETALGVSALAGIVTAGLAPGHFAAAGVALAAAVAAGGAGIGLSAAGDARAEGGKGRPEAAGGSGVVGAGVGAGAGRAPVKRELEAQEVPISYFDPTRRPAANGTTINIDLSRGQWMSGGPETAGQTIDKMLRQGKAAGRR